MKIFSKNLKFNYKGAIKRFALPDTFEQLHKTFAKSYGLTFEEIGTLAFSYTDLKGCVLPIWDEIDYNNLKLLMDRECLDIVKITVAQLEESKVQDYILPAKKQEEKTKIDDNLTIATTQSEVFDEHKTTESLNVLKEIKKKLKAGKYAKKLIKSQKNNTLGSYQKEARMKIRKAVTSALKSVKKEILSQAFAKSDEIIEKLYSTKTNIAKLNRAVHEYVTCDGCSTKPIIGNRYKCAVCDDFDYCETCEEKYSSTHTHPFIKIRSPERSPLQIISVVNEPEDTPLTDKLVANMKDKMYYYVNKVVDYEKMKEFVKNKMSKGFDFTKFKDTINSNFAAALDHKKILECFGNYQNEMVPKSDLSSACQTSSLQSQQAIHINPQYIEQPKALFNENIRIQPEYVEVPKEIFKKEIKPQTCTEMLKKKKQPKKSSKKKINYSKLVEEMKATYELKGVQDKCILNALIMTGGNKETALENLCNSKINL